MKLIQELPSENNEMTKKKKLRNGNEQTRESDNEETRMIPNGLVNHSDPATWKTCHHRMREILVEYGPI